MEVADGKVKAPDLWRHDRSGGLSWAYAGSENFFSWRAEQVADMARQWRSSHPSPDAEQQLWRAAHERLAALTRRAGLGPADVVIHDLGRAEIRATWEDEQLVLIVEDIDNGASPESAQ